MKKVITEYIETHTAFDRRKYCPVCSGHIYQEIMLEHNPVFPPVWVVRCEECETEGPEMPTRAAAMREWKKL